MKINRCLLLLKKSGGSTVGKVSHVTQMRAKDLSQVGIGSKDVMYLLALHNIMEKNLDDWWENLELAIMKRRTKQRSETADASGKFMNKFLRKTEEEISTDMILSRMPKSTGKRLFRLKKNMGDELYAEWLANSRETYFENVFNLGTDEADMLLASDIGNSVRQIYLLKWADKLVPLLIKKLF